MMSDPTTQSNYFEVVSQHIALDWHIDFETKTVSGSATHTLLVKESGVKEIV
jgi:leukotriene-A4 hydrolase